MNPLDRELAALSDRLRDFPTESARSAWHMRVTAPVFRAFDWQPVLTQTALDGLITAMREGGLREGHLGEAVRELRRNLSELERARQVWGKLPSGRLRLLSEAHQTLLRTRSLLRLDRARSVHARQLGEAAALQHALWQRLDGTGDGAQLAPVRAIVRAARSERELLGRRRRLLEAARALLLDLEVTATAPQPEASALSDVIGRELTRIGSLQAIGLAPDVALTYQLREALRRRDRHRAHAAALSIARAAMDVGDAALVDVTSDALARLWTDSDLDRQRDLSTIASGRALFGESFVGAVEAALERARMALARPAIDETIGQRWRREAHLRQTQPAGLSHLLRAGLSVDARFELGAPMSALRIQSRERDVRLAPEPAAHMHLTLARDVRDLPRAVIQDPRTVLFDLAAGRLLTRTYEHVRTRLVERKVMLGEVRIYCLDGSSSMYGPRAFMRDAILLSELRCLEARLSDPDRYLQPVLFYRYFNDVPGPTQRIDRLELVPGAIGDVLETVRGGGTDIQAALASCYALIKAAQGQDRELARAQIVLVTDGRAPIHERALWQKRKTLGALPVGLSVIALGEENAALRRLVARQRKRGERVFYHFLSDVQIDALVSGERCASLPLHAPEHLGPDQVLSELSELARALSEPERVLDPDAHATAAHLEAAHAELAEALETPPMEAPDARREALRGERAALDRRFDRWFPPHVAEAAGRLTRARPRRPDDRADLTRVHDMLEAIAEVVELLHTGSLTDRSDAIELVERMSLEAGIGPNRYDALLDRYRRRLSPALARIRAAALAGDLG